MSEPVLQVKGLKTYYYTEEGVVPAVDGLDFEVGAGRNVCHRRRKRLRQVCDLAVHPAPDSLAARQNY